MKKRSISKKEEAKPKLAFFDFTDCEGCQLQFANMGDLLLQLTELVEIVNFREIMSEHGQDYDIAFVEGSITTERDINRIKKIRDKAKILIALGSCATIGGINAIKNKNSIDLAKERVYGKNSLKFVSIKTMPLHMVVKVDYFIHGCPVYLPEVINVIKCVLAGKSYSIPDYPVCVECKSNENVCRFEKDEECFGPITRGGCNSWCINYGNKCFGCRGLINDPKTGAYKEVMLKFGVHLKNILKRFTLYNGSFGERYEKEFETKNF